MSKLIVHIVIYELFKMFSFKQSLHMYSRVYQGLPLRSRKVIYLFIFLPFQLKKLGKLLPDQILPASIRTTFQDMWANNGDAISRQYAGTAAMKVRQTRSYLSLIAPYKRAAVQTRFLSNKVI